MPPAADPAYPASQRPSLYLLYHELTDQPTSYSYALPAELFRAHLQVVREAQLKSEWLNPCITFDDGHLSNHTLALPALNEFGLRAHFFITAGWTSTRQGYMTVDHLRDLHRNGHTIGAHGWSHQLLTHCTPAELQAELVRPRQALEDLLGTEVRTLSLPGGRFNHAVLAACRDAGYTEIYTSAPAASRRNDPLPGRLNVRANTTPQALTEWLDPHTGALRRASWQYRLKQTGKRLLGDDLYARLWAHLNRAPADATAQDA